MALPRNLLGTLSLTLRRRTPTGAPPGTLVPAAGARPPTIELWRYGPEEVIESSPSSAEELRDLGGAFPVNWVNVDGLGDAGLIERLGEIFDLHPLIQEDILNTYQRAKVELHGERLFLVCRMFDLTAAGLRSEQFSLLLGGNHLLTFQEIPGDCLGAVRRRLRENSGRIRRHGADYLAYALLDAIIDAYFPVLEAYGEKLEEIEDEILGRPTPQLAAEIHLIKRDLFALRRAVWPLREAIGTLLREPLPAIAEETRVYLRDSYDHCVQIIDLLETYRELGADLTDLYLTSVGFRTNETIRVLTVIATIFIPLTFLAGVWGMNFDPDSSPYNMPELRWRYGYPIALGAMALLGVGMLVYFVRRQWLSDRAPSAATPPGDRPESGAVSGEGLLLKIPPAAPGSERHKHASS